MYSVTLNVVVYVQRKSSELNIFSSICNFFFLSCLMAAVNVSYNSTDIAGTLTERTDSSEEQTKVVEQMVMKIIYLMLKVLFLWQEQQATIQVDHNSS